MTEKSRDLLPCPFCGKRPEIWTGAVYETHPHGDIRRWVNQTKVFCRNQSCAARPEVKRKTKPGAFNAWNKRA